MGLHPDEYESAEKQLRKGKDPVCIVTERKGGWLQITFFGSEVIAKIHELKKPSKDGRLFSFPEDGRVLRDYFVIVQEALNEPEFSSHKLRRYFETRLETRAPCYCAEQNDGAWLFRRNKRSVFRTSTSGLGASLQKSLR